jgi:hypothetical protein
LDFATFLEMLKIFLHILERFEVIDREADDADVHRIGELKMKRLKNRYNKI